MDDKRDRDLSFTNLYKTQFTQLVHRCIKKLRNDKYSAEDIVSDTFKILYEKWETLPDTQDKVLICWLYGALKKKCFEYYRSEDRNAIEFSEELFYNPNYDVSYSEMNAKYQSYIEEIKNRLSEQDWVVFECVVIHKQSARQVAEHLNITENTFYVRWHRIKSKIEQFIQEVFY